ncbi:MAG: FecR family protein [Verrucomicrobia bacterium]|nr:FecR family protein [Verrucomicrobiota bacterium]
MKRHLLSPILAALFAIAIPALQAAPLKDAKITRIVNDVKTAGEGKAPKRASLNETVLPGSAVRTGIDSRTEMLFSDQTITRLGANSNFSFNEGTREMTLSKGVIMLQVPKGLGGAKIQTAAVTAAITGTTILMEVGIKFTKLIVVEGTCTITLKAGKWKRKVKLTAGMEIIVPNDAIELPKTFFINLNMLVKTSALLAGKWGTPLDERQIAAAILAQNRQFFGESNIPFTGTGKKPSFISDIPRQETLQIPTQPVTPVTTPPQPKPVTTPPQPDLVGGSVPPNG